MKKVVSVFSLEEQLKNDGILQAGGNVRSRSLNEKMWLVGFVPFNIPDNDIENYGNTSVDFALQWGVSLNDKIIVGSSRIRISNSRFTYPIMKEIIPAKGKVFDFEPKVLIMALHKNVLSSNTSECKPVFSIYFNSPNEYNSQKVLSALRKQRIVVNNLKKAENGLLQYTASDDEYEFSRTYGEYKCVGNSFVCLCEYINTVTGNPSFALFNPDDLVKVE